MLYVFQSVVSASAPARAKAVPPYWQRHVVDNDEKIYLRSPEGTPHVRFERVSAEIHVSLWFHETNFSGSDAAVRNQCIVIFTPSVKMPNVGQVVHYPPADVVARRNVLPSRIAKTNDDFHDRVRKPIPIILR